MSTLLINKQAKLCGYVENDVENARVLGKYALLMQKNLDMLPNDGVKGEE